MIHFDYLIGMKVGGSAGMLEEQWICKRLINTKQCGSASQLHMKYSGLLGSKVHCKDCVSGSSPVLTDTLHERGDISWYHPSPPRIQTHTYWTLVLALYGDACSLWQPHTLPHPAPMH